MVAFVGLAPDDIITIVAAKLGSTVYVSPSLYPLMIADETTFILMATPIASDTVN